MQDEQCFRSDFIEIVLHCQHHCRDDGSNVGVEHRRGVTGEEHSKEVESVYLHVRSGCLIAAKTESD